MTDNKKEIEELGRTVSTTTENLERAEKAMDATGRSVNRLRDALTSLDRFAQQASRAFAMVDDRAKSTSSTFADFANKIAEVDSESNRMRKALMSVNDATRQSTEMNVARNLALDGSTSTTNRLLSALAQVENAKKTEIEALEEELGLVRDTTRARQEFTEAISGNSEATSKGVDQNARSREMLEALNKSLSDRKNGTNSLKRALYEQVERLAEEYPKLTLAVQSANAGFRAISKTLQGVISIASSAVGIVANIATALVRLPFRLLGRLQEDLAESFSRFDTLRKATQDLRGELGSLEQGAGSSALRIARELARTTGAFTQANLAIQGSLESIFGHFEDATWAMQSAAASIIKDFGGLFYRFQSDVEGSAQQLFMFREGLGLSGDALQAFAREAQLGGRSVVEELTQLNIVVQSASQTFGISSRDIASDVSLMRTDFARFGGVAVQELANTSIYLRRMGLEVQDVTSLLDGFDNFETAADSAAALAQGLGMNVDAMELFMADDPTERLEVLRRSFTETGRSFDDLTRRERSYLAQHTGLSQETLSLALSQSGLAMSMSDVQDAQDQAASSTLTEAQAMRELADSIKLMVDRSESMTGAGGVLGSITSGFSELFIRSGAIVEIQRNFEGLILSASGFGRELAALLADQPLVNEFFGTIAQVFDPERWGLFFDSTITNLNAFFTDLESGDSQALSRLLENMLGDARTLLEPGNEIYQSLAGAFRSLFVAGVEQVTIALEEAKPHIYSALDRLSDFLTEWWDDRGEELLMPLAEKAGIGLGGVFVTAALGNAVMSVAPGMIARGVTSMLSAPAVTGAAGAAGTATGGGFASSMAAAFTNPITGGIVAVAAAGLAGLAARSFREKHAEEVAALEQELGRDWSTLRGGRLATLVGGIADFFGADGAQWFRDTVEWTQTLSPLLSGLVGIVDKLVIMAEGVGSFFGGFWDIMQGTREAIWSIITLDFDGFTGGISRMFGGLGEMIGGVMTTLRGVFTTIVSVGQSVGDLFGALWVKVSDFWENTEFSFSGFIDFVRGIGGRLYNASLSFVGSFIDGIKEGLGINSPPKRIIEIFDLVVDTIKDIIDGVTGIITYPFGAAWSAVRGVFGFGEEASEGGIAQTFTDIVGGVQMGLVGVSNMIREPFRAGWGMVKGLFGFGGDSSGQDGLTVQALFQGIRDTISDAVSTISDIILGPFRTARDGIAAIVGGEDGILSTIGSIGFSALSGISGVIGNVSPSNILSGIADSATGLLGSILPSREQATSFAQTLTSPLQDVVGGLGGEIQSAFTRSFDEGILSGVRRISEEYTMIDRVLSRGLPAVSLSGTLRRFNEAVEVARETITMDSAPINLNVTLNVTLDAEQLVYSLSDEMLPARLARDV